VYVSVSAHECASMCVCMGVLYVGMCLYVCVRVCECDRMYKCVRVSVCINSVSRYV
jgi:hypothetical protein